MNQTWKVLLIGGSSATGKSYLSRQLSEKYKTPVMEVDDIRIVLQQKLKSVDNPDLFFFLENKSYLSDFPIDTLLAKLESVGNEVWLSLNSLIEKHIVCNEPIIFEGDGIIPKLLAQRNQEQTKSIFIYDDRESIRQRELVRQRGGNNPSLDKQIEFSYQYGQLMKNQAETNGFITICASPIESLYDRAILEINRE